MSTMAKENNVVDVSRCRAAEAPVRWRGGGGGGKVERGTRTEALRFDSKTFDVSTVNTCIFAHIRNLHTHTRTHTGKLIRIYVWYLYLRRVVRGEWEGEFGVFL